MHLTVTEVDGSIRILGEYEAGIAKITYYWNEEEKVEELGHERSKIEKLIDMPQGNNTLTIEMVGTDGERKNFKETFRRKHNLNISCRRRI